MGSLLSAVSLSVLSPRIGVKFLLVALSLVSFISSTIIQMTPSLNVHKANEMPSTNHKSDIAAPSEPSQNHFDDHKNKDDISTAAPNTTSTTKKDASVNSSGDISAAGVDPETNSLKSFLNRVYEELVINRNIFFEVYSRPLLRNAFLFSVLWNVSNGCATLQKSFAARHSGVDRDHYCSLVGSTKIGQTIIQFCIQMLGSRWRTCNACFHACTHT